MKQASLSLLVLVTASFMHAVDESNLYSERLGSSENIKACLERIENEGGGFIISNDLFQRLYVQASEDPAFEAVSIKLLMSRMEPDVAGIRVRADEAYMFHHLLNYIPWNGHSERGKYATYYQLYLNGLCAEFFMDGVYDMKRKIVYLPSLTQHSSEVFKNDKVRCAAVATAYKVLYEKARNLLAKESENQFLE